MRQAISVLLLSLVAASPCFAGPAPDPKKVGVVADTDAGLIELTTYGSQGYVDSIQEGVQAVFKFSKADVPKAHRCDAFFVNLPGSLITDSQLIWTPELDPTRGLKMDDAATKRMSDLKTDIENVVGNSYKITSPDLAGKTNGYALLFVKMPPGSPSRLYPVGLGSGVGGGSSEGPSPHPSGQGNQGRADARSLEGVVVRIERPRAGPQVQLRAGGKLYQFALGPESDGRLTDERIAAWDKVMNSLKPGDHVVVEYAQPPAEFSGIVYGNALSARAASASPGAVPSAAAATRTAPEASVGTFRGTVTSPGDAKSDVDAVCNGDGGRILVVSGGGACTAAILWSAGGTAYVYVPAERHVHRLDANQWLQNKVAETGLSPAQLAGAVCKVNVQSADINFVPRSSSPAADPSQLTVDALVNACK